MVFLLLIHTPPQKEDHSNSVVYKIPCKTCDMSYIGETGRGLQKRKQEHIRDLRFGIESNSLVAHREATEHLPNMNDITILARCRDKRLRKITESIYIKANKTINTRESSHRISTLLCKTIISSNPIIIPLTDNRTHFDQ